MKKYDYIIIAAIILYFVENVYFGMNETAKTVAEKVVDGVVLILFVYGFATMFLDHLRPSVNVTLNGIEASEVHGIIQATREWHDELLDTDKPCVMCGAIPDNILKMARILNELHARIAVLEANGFNV